MKATRVITGAICFKNASVLPKIETSNIVKPVMLPPGRARLVAQPTPMGSLAPGMTIGTERESCINMGMTRPPAARMASGFDEIRLAASAHTRSMWSAVHRSSNCAFAPRPPELCEFFPKCPDADAHFRVVLQIGHENPDAPHAFALRARRQRPRGRAAQQRDELAAFQSITLSARTRIDSGTVRPSAFAVLRLMTSSNFVGCSTGRLAGLAPLRILST